MKLKIFFCILILHSFVSLNAQTSLNPDVSLIGDFRLFSHNDNSRPNEVEKLNFSEPSMELNISGYLNPYARADAVIAWHQGHNAAIEELYATILRGLPLGMNLRVGKYLLEFGRINPVHEHAWSFIQRPLPHQIFFGEEGLSDMAVRASFLLPSGDAYTELMGAILKGDALSGHHHSDTDEHEHSEISIKNRFVYSDLTISQNSQDIEIEEKKDLGFFGRLTSSLAVSETAELAFGASALNAVYAISEDEGHKQLRCWTFGCDLKYKNKKSRYSSLQIEAEGIVRSVTQHDGDKLTSYGAYGYLDYRFKQKYNIGGIYEWLQTKSTEDHEHEDEIHHIEPITQDSWRSGLFVGFAPIEETSLVRLAGYWNHPAASDGFWEIALQFVISLGPHKPHNF